MTLLCLFVSLWSIIAFNVFPSFFDLIIQLMNTDMWIKSSKCYHMCSLSCVSIEMCRLSNMDSLTVTSLGEFTFSFKRKPLLASKARLVEKAHIYQSEEQNMGLEIIS